MILFSLIFVVSAVIKLTSEFRNLHITLRSSYVRNKYSQLYLYCIVKVKFMEVRFLEVA